MRPNKISGFLENFVDDQEKFVVEKGENPEDPQRILETVAYPLKSPLENRGGGAFFPFREDFKEVAAPEP
jgi:hypothetical protein